MKLHQSLKSKVCVFILTLVCSWAFAEVPKDSENLVEVPPDSGLVEVQIQRDTLTPYKQRRRDHGYYFSITGERLFLENYISTLDGNSYKTMFRDFSIPLVQASMEYKYNFILGAVAAGINYGQGEIKDDKSGTERRLMISKYGFNVKYVADYLFSEPYVAPYVAADFWQMEVREEKGTTESFAAKTQMGTNYTLGLLFQLDWLDSDVAKSSTFNWGLENTFVDIYATKYAKTEAADDPDTETDIVLGAGFRFEF